MRSTRELLKTPHRFPRPIEAASDEPSRPLRPVETGDCPKCHGARWLRADVPFGQTGFGTLIQCDCILEIEERQRSRDNRNQSQLAGLKDRTFASFDETVEGVAEAVDVSRSFADNPDGWIVMSGRCGCGKTHLAVAIANAQLSLGTPNVMFAVVPDLLDHLRSTFDPSKGVSYDKRFNQFRDASLLVLDDLGTENATPWAKEKLFQIINHRYNERAATVITTNRPFDEIDERVVSRMLDRSFSRLIKFDHAEDFRRRGQPDYVRGRTSRRNR